MTGSKTITIPDSMMSCSSNCSPKSVPMRGISALSVPDAVSQIEMLDPRADAVIGLDGGFAQLEGRNPRFEDVQGCINHRPPATELRLLAIVRHGVGTVDPGSSIVGGVALPNDARVHPDDVTLAQESVGGDGRVGQIAVQSPGSELTGRSHHLPDRINSTGGS